MIHVIGSGAAGKTTLGAALASRLGYFFIDLDQRYLIDRDINQDIETLGYENYVTRNVDLYLKLRAAKPPGTVISLSSGFMTYDTRFHPAIDCIHRSILSAADTILIMPSFDLEDCVQETITRQLARDYTSNDADKHREVIMKRFPVYGSMGSITVTSDKPMDEILEDVLYQLGGV